MRGSMTGWLAGLTLALFAFCGSAPAHDDGTKHTHRVDAPGVDIIDRDDGTRRIKAPFVDIELDGRGGERVRAPFTDVDTRVPAPKPAPAPKTFLYAHPDGLYTLAVPAGWQPMGAADPSVVGFHDPSGAAAVKVMVFADRRYDAAELQSVAQAAWARCQAALPDVKALGRINAELGGCPAVRTDVIFAQKGVPNRGVMFVSIHNGRAVTLTIRASAAKFDDLMPTLYAIAGSYKSGGK